MPERVIVAVLQRDGGIIYYDETADPERTTPLDPEMLPEAVRAMVGKLAPDWVP